MWIKHLLLFLFLCKQVVGYIEFVEVNGCENCTLHLTCRHLSSVLAILEASFQSSENSSTVAPTIFPPLPPRLALNKRCSGVNHCSFILVEDCPGADKWGPGNLTVKYACVSERRMSKYCNTVINLPSKEDRGVSEGFARNPGYPRFYSGQQDCRWTIKAPPEQTIKIIILDLAISSDQDVCTDVLEVKDSTQTVYTSCTSDEPPPVIQTGSDTMEIVLSSRRALTPRRGVLFYYTAVGCPTPAPPKNGHLVHRNDTVALLRCCEGFAFPDINSRSRVLRCLGHRWDVELPVLDCDNKTVGVDNKIAVGIQELRPNCDTMAGETGSDILLPTLVIVFLLLVNSIIVFIIYRYRQRRQDDYLEEELGSLGLTDRKT